MIRKNTFKHLYSVVIALEIDVFVEFFKIQDVVQTAMQTQVFNNYGGFTEIKRIKFPLSIHISNA